jgi:4-hydroxybenzoate polyprenyltransferase
MEKLYSIFRLIRPKTLLWFCVSTCYGFASVILNEAPPFHFIFLVLTIVLANIGAIIVNDIGDIEVDKKSSELLKRNRPLVTGAISIKEAKALAILFYLLSLFTSLFYGFSATIFAIVVILFSLSYSLPPFKFSSRPYSSILYWVVLCSVCYFLMLFALENINNGFDLTFNCKTCKSNQGFIFITSIIFFMGIAEIISKDLRDLINDAEGGRNTYVNFVGVEIAAKVLILFAWFGFILWMEALYLSGAFPYSIAAWLCLAVGFIWCLKIHIHSIKLMKEFHQPTATKLHIQWTYAYALMQVLTYSVFYFK